MVASCPACDLQRLQRLLRDELTEHDESLATQHIEQCAACRTQLEALAGEKTWWQEASRQLRGSQWNTDGTLWLTTRDLHSANDAASDSWISSLDFLEPSDNPAMLGRLKSYEILEVIGTGGFGIVLKGYERELNRHVAIKVLSPHLAHSAAARKRFTREAQAAAAVVHPNVVAIHTVDASAALPYLVMPLISGESLQQRLDRQGPLEVKEVLRIGLQTAQGLAAAHAQGLVHRDIKPANILLEYGVDRVMLTDFGLARAMDDASLTRSTVIAGTPQFMSPEQARGETIDHRADLFSLGSVLYAMCAGYPPFRAETMLGVLRRVSEETPRPIRDLNAEVPPWLATIIERLLSKEPACRFATAVEVADLLAKCLAHLQQPMVVPLPVVLAGSKSRRSFDWMRRGTGPLRASLLALFGTLGAAWLMKDREAGIREAAPSAAPAESRRARFPADAPPQPTAASASVPIEWDDHLTWELSEISAHLQWLEVAQEE